MEHIEITNEKWENDKHENGNVKNWTVVAFTHFRITNDVVLKFLLLNLIANSDISLKDPKRNPCSFDRKCIENYV